MSLLQIVAVQIEISRGHSESSAGRGPYFALIHCRDASTKLTMAAGQPQICAANSVISSNPASGSVSRIA